MDIKAETKIGDVVKENFKTAQVFDKHHIDFCCGGNISLGEACQAANSDVSKLIPELEALMELSDADSKYIDNLELDDLSDYIMERHHSYVTETVPFLQQKLQKLCDVHGAHHSELFEIKVLFDAAAQKLTQHMKNEEEILFPAIRKIVKSRKEELDLGIENSELVAVIESMEEEHTIEGERFKRISDLSGDYTCPPDGCNTFEVTYTTLRDFETDLHRHIHLENNILFKKALAL